MKRLFLLALLVLAYCTSAFGQSADVGQGLIPYGSFQRGDIDSVNLANGNVVLHIPLESYPQRGGKLDLSFYAVYNNKIWYQYNFGTGSQWRFDVAGVLVGPAQGMTSCAQLLKVVDYSGANWFIHTAGVITADGSFHEIVPTDGDPRTWSYGESLDASGIRFARTGGTAWDRNGVTYATTPNCKYHGVGSANATITDPNGNQISYGSSGWTDTLGRVIPGYPTTGTMLSSPGVSSTTTNCPSGTASALQWTVPAYNGSSANIKFCYANFSYQTHFNVPGINENSGTALLINAIVLPNLTMWTFNYDSYLNLTSVTFPTGGSLAYSWLSQVVASRTLNANDGTGSHTTNYQWRVLVGSNYYNIVTDPAGNDALSSGDCDRVTQTQTYSGSHSTGTLLKTSAAQYHCENDPLGQYYSSSATVNVVPLSQTVSLPGGKTSQTATTFDSGFTYYIFNLADDSISSYNGYYGKPVLQTFSDFGSGAPGPILKQNSTAYQWQSSSTYLTANLLNLPQTSKVLDASGHTCAETDYTYDNASYLTTSGITTQHISVSGPRANVSSITHQLTSTPCSSTATWRGITSYFNAYDTGVTYQPTDPLGHNAIHSYSSSFAGAYRTQSQPNNTTTPGVSGSVSHSSSANYDFNTGLPISTTDENSNVTNLQYDTSFRLTQSSLPDGGLLNFSYQDSSPFGVTVTRKITSTMNEVTTAKVDGVGRLSQTQFVDPNCTVGSALVKSDFVYTEDTTLHDLLSKSSTPYCDTPNTIYGLMAVTHSDTLNRAKSVVQTDSSTATTTYNDNQTTVTDEAGKKRTSQVDGLGRVTKVWEDPSGVNWETDYQYDPLGNLLRVDQQGTSPGDSSKWRTRTFTYDSLSRMLTSYNPERGTITYTYNDDGMVATRIAPKPNQTNSSVTVTTTYSYDEMHRLTTVSYSDGTTPTLKYTYDGVTPSGCTPPTLTATNPKPHRTSMCDAAGASSWSFDVMGRVLTDKRTTNSLTKTTSYTYNADGSVATLTYPSGRMITYTYNAAARPISAVDVANSINYVTAATYAPQGALASLQNGGSIVSTMYFNSRLQPCRMSVKSSGTAPASCTDTATGNVLDFTYAFNLGSGDNGNVLGITNNRDTTRSQTFSYDALNRLSVAQTTSTFATSPSHCWGEQFTYDAWANLTTIGSSGSAYTGCTQESLSVGVNGNNQITNTGFAYDATGNTTGDGAYTYVYDGENQLTSAGGVTYTYDGEGRRVQKSNGKLYWYGSGSDPLDESDASGNVTNEYIFFAGARIARRDSSGNVNYYFADRLGTARVVTNSSGSVLDDSDFYPFGGERIISSSSGNTYKFESKERDAETGNDDFGARFYASRYGRFLSVDWSALPAPVPYANLTNPQTLNLFSFVADNPETFADLDGHVPANYFQKWDEIVAPPGHSDGTLTIPGGEPTVDDTAEVSEEQKNKQNQAAAPPTCSDVKVAATVIEEPRMLLDEKQEDGTSLTGVSGTVQFTITVKGQPLADTKVDEKNVGALTVDGKEIKSRKIVEAHDQGTNNAGQLSDQIGILRQAGTAKTITALTTHAVNDTGTQTLTFKIPGGATCSATSKRTLTNVGLDGKISSNYILTTTQPVVKPVGP